MRLTSSIGFITISSNKTHPLQIFPIEIVKRRKVITKMHPLIIIKLIHICEMSKQYDLEKETCWILLPFHSQTVWAEHEQYWIPCESIAECTANCGIWNFRKEKSLFAAFLCFYVFFSVKSCRFTNLTKTCLENCS